MLIKRLIQLVILLCGIQSTQAYGQVVGPLASAQSDKTPKYRIVDLGHLPGGLGSYATAINKSGQIAGFDYFNYENNTISVPRAFLYDDGRIVDLGTLGGVASAATGINVHGHVVGSASIASDPYFSRHAFFYDGTMHDVGTLGGSTSEALRINKTDQVVGYARLNDFVSHAFLYDGSIHDLGTLREMTNSQANDINDQGQIVGVSWDSNTVPTNFRAFLYDGTFHDLGTLGGSTSIAAAINNKGVVVGTSQILSGVNHAFLYDGSMHDLGSFADGITFANAINKRGQVVGSWATYDAQGSQKGLGAFLYQEGTLYDLMALLDSGGDEWVQLIEAAAINNSGQIVGAGIKTDGVHAFRLDQVCEDENDGNDSDE
jgi:probable HAF family extracellular repeat protein